MSQKRRIDESSRPVTASGMSVVKRVKLDLGPQEKIISHTDDEVRKLLDTQTNTDVSLNSVQSRYKEFSSPATYKSALNALSGSMGLETYQRTINEESERQSLRDSGLNEEEVELYLKYRLELCETLKSSEENRLLNKEIIAERLEQIQRKIDEHTEEICKHTGYSSAKIVSRLRLELEQSLNQGRSDIAKLSSLVMKSRDVNNESLVKKISDEITNKILIKNKPETKRIDTGPAFPHPWTPVNEKLPPEQGFIGPKSKDLDLDVSDDFIDKNRLSNEEIRQLPKFKNYLPGVPNQKLFVKNIGSTVKQEHLEHLLSRFNTADKPSITCKLMTGKMRGQAFVECHNEDLAMRILISLNGYILRGRPLIIQYAKSKD